jgi:hypothetical protein
VSAGKGKRARKRKVRTERPVPPAERLACILKAQDEHAFSTAPNALLHRKTPMEALAACRELASWLFRQSHQREGDQYIHLTMVHALQGIEEQLKPLFEAAREIAAGERT